VPRPTRKKRERGSIRRRGSSFLVEVYGGIDPLTGRRVYLNGSTTDEAEAERIRTRLLSQVDQQRHAKTKASLRTAIEEWLKIHEVGQSTREGL
jgi:integrase